MPSGAAAAKYVRECLEDGREIVTRRLLQESTSTALRLLSSPKSPFDAGVGLSLYANWHTRLGYYEMLSGRQVQNDVKHGWSVDLLAALFQERALLQRAKELGSFAQYREKVSPVMPSDVFKATFVLCGRYALGMHDQWSQYANVFEAWRLRDELRIFDDEQTFDFPFALIRFLSRPRPQRAELVALDKTFPFAGIAQAWNDDAAFAALTDKWCQWHVEHSERRRENIWAHAVLPHDFLFPSWIFAIDRHRTNALGRSSLGRHELVSYGTKLSAAIAGSSAAAPQPLLVGEQLYRQQFGSEPFDFVSFWRDFKT